MIDGSSCSRMKFASLVVNNTILTLYLLLFLLFSCLNLTFIYLFDSTYISVYQLHFRTCEGYIYFGRRGAIGDPVLGGVPGGGFRGGAGGDRKSTRLNSSHSQ